MSVQKVPETRAGWLLKQSRGDSFLKNWRKRYVVLEPGKLTYYAKCAVNNGITTGVDCKGVLNLENAKVFRGSGRGILNTKHNQRLYIVAGTDELNLYLEAPTIEDAEDWISAVENHARFATSHPTMVGSPEQRPPSSTLDIDPVEKSFENSESTTCNYQNNYSPEDTRFNSTVMKTMICPSLHGILLKTLDECSNTTAFISVVSHPLCQDTDKTTSDKDEGAVQYLTLVNPRCWYFCRDKDSHRQTTTKLGLRHYCEPSLSVDGETYVVFQILVSVKMFHALLQDVLNARQALKISLQEVIVSPPPLAALQIRELALHMAAALADSHQVCCLKHFNIVHFEEQDYQPFYVCPMELVIGRCNEDKSLNILTTMDNIQRHTEVLYPSPGVQLTIRGQGVVPPSTSKRNIQLHIKLHSHAVCDKMRDLQIFRDTKKLDISSPLMTENNERDLNHSVEECSKAIFLWDESEVIHDTDLGDETYCYNVVTNSTVIRLLNLDNYNRNMLQTTSSDRGDDMPSTSSRSTPAPNMTDVVSLHVLQSLSRFFEVKMSAYTSQVTIIDSISSPLPPSPTKDSVSTSQCTRMPSVKVIKFSAGTWQASRLFVKDKHISNNYDNLSEFDSIGELGNSNRPASLCDVYGHNSFSLCRNDIIFTDTEFFACKLKEITNRAMNILDALEDTIVSGNDTPLSSRLIETSSFKCMSYIITSELPAYVLDYPLIQNDKLKSFYGVGKTKGPDILSKIQEGDRVNVFCVKEYSNSSWLLIDSGWIPSDAGKYNSISDFKLPSKVSIHSPGFFKHLETEKVSSDTVVVECYFESIDCKGKSLPFRRQCKIDNPDRNPFSYDKSSDYYCAVPIILLLRTKTSIIELCTADAIPDNLKIPENALLSTFEETINKSLESGVDNNNEVWIASLKELLSPTENDLHETENFFTVPLSSTFGFLKTNF